MHARTYRSSPRQYPVDLWPPRHATPPAVGALPDDLLLDIFGRLQDPIDLLRCAATCRRWLSVVAVDDAAFLRRAGVLLEKRKASLLLGVFYHYLPGSATNKVNMDCPPAPRFWRLARPGSGLLSILPNPNGLFNYAKPLASRHGLLLVRLMPAPVHYQKLLHLAVCHPLLGGVHHVPPPPVVFNPWLLGKDVTGYALLTGYGGEGLHDHRHRQLAFRVLFTAVLRDRAVYAYSYSSATGSWSAPVVCPVRGLTMSGPRAGIVDDRGTAHWLYKDQTRFYILDVTADAARISLTKTPILVEGEYVRRVMMLQPPFPCIAQGGKLALASVKQPAIDMTLKLWTKQDHQGNNQDWIYHELPMSRRSFEHSTMPFRVIGSAGSKGTCLIVKSYFGMYYLDLESMELEPVRGSEYSNAYPREVCSASTSMCCEGYNSCTNCTYNNCVLYELDWPSYLLHLSVWSPRGAT